MSSILDKYNKLTNFPGGRFLFNKAIGFAAPFFAKVHPNIKQLEVGLCVVEIKDRRSIRNHIGTINAGAMCTLAELTAGMAVDASIPKSLRWIPKQMCVAYLKKASGTLTAVCRFDASILQPGDIEIPVQLLNSDNEKVFSATIGFYISQKPAKP